MHASSLRIERLDSMSRVRADQWDALVRGGDPFIAHAFLLALENEGAVGEEWGWYPRHLTAWREDRLVGAIPCYGKTNSYGELVFDWAWADAYHRHGLRYYPKLVSAVPYTPASGQRLLLAAGEDADAVAHALMDTLVSDAREAGFSSIHVLFPHEAESDAWVERGFFSRQGVQFHWRNPGDWRDFDDYLAALTSKKRKNIRRERRLVSEAGVRLEVRHGDEMDDAHWSWLHRFYRSTFERKSGHATLSEGFFREVGRTMPRSIVVVLAYRGDSEQAAPLAASVMFRSDDTLYGRHWGCLEHVDGLHFEACYYQGLEYCLREGLTRFEPGAQGEFKISRGFLPSTTWSTHWMADRRFHDLIARHVHDEAGMMEDYKDELSAHSPFREIEP
ncbi:MAG: GNAT family N-acetyltransferase [Gammaproteobacteria bacterium]